MQVRLWILYAMQQIYLVSVLSGLTILPSIPKQYICPLWVVSGVRTKAPQFFSLSLPLDLFFGCLVVFCPHNLPCYEYKGHVTYQVVCTEGLVACYTYPRAPIACPKQYDMEPKHVEMPMWKKMGQRSDWAEIIAAVLLYPLH
jgi:hypothetical protein